MLSKIAEGDDQASLKVIKISGDERTMNHAFILNRNQDQLITSGSPWLLGKGK